MNCFKPFNPYILIAGFLLILSLDATSQSCFNSDFESGNIDGYSAFIGNIASDGTIRIDNQVCLLHNIEFFLLQKAMIL